MFKRLIGQFNIIGSGTEFARPSLVRLMLVLLGGNRLIEATRSSYKILNANSSFGGWL
jgi:hypothetical protein